LVLASRLLWPKGESPASWTCLGTRTRRTRYRRWCCRAPLMQRRRYGAAGSPARQLKAERIRASRATWIRSSRSSKGKRRRAKAEATASERERCSSTRYRGLPRATHGDGGGRVVCSYCQGRKVVGFSMPWSIAQIDCIHQNLGGFIGVGGEAADGLRATNF